MGGWFNALLQQQMNGFQSFNINVPVIKIAGRAGQLGDLLNVGTVGNTAQFENLGVPIEFHGGVNGVPLVIFESTNDAIPQIQLQNQANAVAGNCAGRIAAFNATGAFTLRMTTDGVAHSGQLAIGDGLANAFILLVGDGANVTQLGVVLGGGLTFKSPTGVTPAGAAGILGLGTQSGFGAGAAGTAVTTTLLGGGTGPATPQTIVNYLKISLGGAFFWIPLAQ